MSTVMNSLTLMWKGMAAIFAVILIIYLLILLITDRKKKDK